MKLSEARLLAREHAAELLMSLDWPGYPKCIASETEAAQSAFEQEIYMIGARLKVSAQEQRQRDAIRASRKP